MATPTLGAPEARPADQLAAAQLVDTGIARDAEQPRLDLQCHWRTPVPRALRLFPGGQGQIVTIVGVAHQALDLTEDSRVVRSKPVFDEQWIAVHRGQLAGLGSAHVSTLEGVHYGEFMRGLRMDYGNGSGGNGHEASAVPSGARRWTRALPVSATYS